MILFKKLRWKNFLSTGNAWTEIALTKSKSTLIVGENGAGKSTILDALCFALYGKPFRKINKPQLLNSINGKNLEVEVEFQIGKSNYRIIRGIKPNKFEIYCNGSMINQDAASRDYQEYLEKTVLGLSQKSFSQIVVLGSATFTPFMQLSSMNRREVIEDLLDIQIFTTMNTLLKSKVSDNKDNIREVDFEISNLESTIELQKKHISQLEENNDKLIKEKAKKGLELNAKIEVARQSITTTNDTIKGLRDLCTDQSRVTTRITEVRALEAKIENKASRIKADIKFFHDNESCPTCQQGIEHDFKENKILKENETLDQLNEGMVKLEEELKLLQDRQKEIAEIEQQVSDHNLTIRDLNANISTWNNMITDLQDEIRSLKNDDNQITINRQDIEKAEKTLANSKSRMQELYDDRQVLDIASTILKDGGIKARIIKQYVPIMNKLINRYLASLDFFVAFELDENFNEKIKSRFRDEFSYASFSEGEKMRIDLALLFTWRAISKLRNSVSTNLLIMDEVFDSSLDGSGTDEFLKILNTLTADTNVFIISHKGDQLFDKFHSVIKFEKHKNFSRIAA